MLKINVQNFKLKKEWSKWILNPRPPMINSKASLSILLDLSSIFCDARIIKSFKADIETLFLKIRKFKI
jgi:hypothetical protein